MAEIIGIAICRQASDYLKSGFVTGFACKVCGKELQISPVSLERVREGSLIPLCNPCGFAVEKRLQDAGAPIAVVLTPEATARLEELAIQMVNLGGNN